MTKIKQDLPICDTDKGEQPSCHDSLFQKINQLILKLAKQNSDKQKR